MFTSTGAAHENVSHRRKLLSEYRPPAHTIEDVDLLFKLHLERTQVKTRLVVRRLAQPLPLGARFVELHGSSMLQPVNGSFRINGIKCAAGSIQPTVSGGLRIALDGTAAAEDERFLLDFENVVNPSENKALMGLYKCVAQMPIFCAVFTLFSSNGSLITQCEAEGFRNITYFIDRPDVMASFTTTLVGDAQQFPVMLANGDLLDSKVVNGHRYAVFHCPHRIPSYLFALVAGNFARVSDTHMRPDGRPVSLNIYVPHGCESKTSVAMRALKDCMSFDEDAYGRVCDVNQVRAALSPASMYVSPVSSTTSSPLLILQWEQWKTKD